MVPYTETAWLCRVWPWWRWVLVGLILLALSLSIYLSWHYLVGGAMIGCGGGSSCDQVLNSRWSLVGGVLPVSGLAAGAYMALLMASLFIGPAVDVSVRKLAWAAMLILVGSIAGSAVWFTILQKWVIGAFCPYCMTAHCTGLLIAVLVIWRVFRPFNGLAAEAAETSSLLVSDGSGASDGKVEDGVRMADSAAPERPLGSLFAVGLIMTGLVFSSILAACQIFITPPAVYRDGQSQIDPNTLDYHSVPLVGSPDAPYIVNLLFDYKCPHCQQLHFLLSEVIRRYNNTLAFALCPSPLSTQCNPYIPREVDEYKDSCELAKIGMAVWVARREMFSVFDTWMFSLESGDHWRPRSPDAARAKAIELVGQAKFEVALTDPWIDRYLKASIQIYGTTVQGGNAVPKMVYGSRWVIPEPYDADGLITILQNSLAVPKP